ncbi:MAG TPA: hypothetical protein PK079_08200 [Leptospiraceae bacterium]|nr:hypothetical protein [Leptospiraceae bacterium]HMW06308.1 hypothetical protein [Leptospiraceae bacterium]HMX31013.1 hypothetical protein [Leptospiraceae bacterium]HMY32168.1 hypothetical protein [Leptospiraceae bacterium]HMZ65103.1 hypothetical protein [Leptospiraceae bacterium]
MYPILISLDEPILHFLVSEKIDLSILLKIGLLKEESSDFQYFHSENKKNIRLNLERSYFVLLNSFCVKNHSYMHIVAGELILEIILQILSYE